MDKLVVPFLLLSRRSILPAVTSWKRRRVEFRKGLRFKNKVKQRYTHVSVTEEKMRLVEGRRGQDVK